MPLLGAGAPCCARVHHPGRPHLAQVGVGLAAAAGLQVRKLALEVVHGRGVDKVGLAVAARQVVGQHLGVVLQDLAVDQLPHLVGGVGGN